MEIETTSAATLSDGATKIMNHLKESDYHPGDYLAASRLFYIFEDDEEKKRSLEELVARGLVIIAPNHGVGITPAGEDWNSKTG